MPAAGSCTVCDHEAAVEINEAIILEGRSLRAVAGQYGLSRESVRRHREHIPQLLVQARQHTKEYEADAILLRIERLERETLAQLDVLKEEDEPDRRVILRAIAQQRENIRLIVHVRELIDKAPTINVHISDQAYAALVGALDLYPEAQCAVVEALAPLAELEERGDGSR